MDLQEGNHCVDDNHPYHHDRQTVGDRNSSSSPRGLVHRYFFYNNHHPVQDILRQDMASLQGAFQEQTSVGTELVLASFVDPFEDGNLVQVLLGGASWEAHHRLEEDSIRDSHQVGHHQILVEACIEVVAVAVVAADHLRIPPPTMLPLGEVALPHMALRDIAEASSVLASFLITQRNMMMSAK